MSQGLIVQIVGTNGSGKTTVVRKVMEHCYEVVPQFIEGRAKPISYKCSLSDAGSGPAPFTVVGAYDETMASGCDTIRDAAWAMDYVTARSRTGNVLFEGIRMMTHTRGLQLYNDTKSVVCVVLDTSFEQVMADINARRALVGQGPMTDFSHVKGNVVRANNYAYKLAAIGAKRIKTSRDEAPGIVMDLLRGKR